MKGRVRTIAMAMVKPGIDPANKPAPTPTVMKIKVAGSTIFKKAGKKISIKSKTLSGSHVVKIPQVRM